MSVYEHASIPSVLQAFFDDKKKRNARYSLRAFARDLDLSPSTLSEVLRGTQALSQARLVDVAKRLNLPKSQRDYICAIERKSRAKSEAALRLAESQLKQLGYDSPEVLLRRDQLELRRHWEPMAIVEALKLRDAKRSIDWLSDAIGANTIQVENFCTILCRHGFIRQEPDGTYRALKEKSTNIKPTTPDEEMQKSARQGLAEMLKLGSRALEVQSQDERDFSALIYATAKSSAPEVKEAIKNFRRALASAGEDVSEKDSVYCLAVQWFRVGQLPKARPENTNRGESNQCQPS